ncbi:MAG: hypothetical protein HQ526_09750 [Actinobacteria bacterium]|nr:hypothetical protein [Actinomycetota bacterium]
MDQTDAELEDIPRLRNRIGIGNLAELHPSSMAQDVADLSAESRPILELHLPGAPEAPIQVQASG